MRRPEANARLKPAFENSSAIVFHPSVSGFETAKASERDWPGKRARESSQAASGPRGTITWPLAGSTRSARWANQTLNQSHSSVIVPTVEREVRTALPCLIATDGRTFSAESRAGEGSNSTNWRT